MLLFKLALAGITESGCIVQFHVAVWAVALLAFGVLGYVLRKLEIPTVPVVLGLLLGGQMEYNLRRAMSISSGEWSIIWNSGISVGIYLFAIALLLGGLLLGLPRRERPGRR